MKANTKRAVCRLANTLVKHGYSRSDAMRKAWAFVKLPDITVKVKGTASARLRQKALEHLTRYDPADVSFTIAADSRNKADRNAVAVVAGVKCKGAFVIGYLPRGLATDISPLQKRHTALYHRSSDRRLCALYELWCKGKYSICVNAAPIAGVYERG